jgi:hypothetical protein
MLTYLDTLIGFAVVMLGVSLIITILNQAISTFLAHRGANLLWGLKVLFRGISSSPEGLPVLTANAALLAETVLQHPLVSDSVLSTARTGLAALLPQRLVNRWRLANAIRPDELVGILSHITQCRPEQFSVGLHAMLSAEINSLLNTPAPLAARQSQLATAAAATLPTELVKEAVSVTLTAPGKLEAWFQSIMDRVSQRFTLWMRMWTIFFAFAFAFGGCIDSIHLISEIYRSSDLRAKLVGVAPHIEDLAKKVIPSGSTTEQEAVQKNVAQTTADAVNQAVADAKITGAPKATADDFSAPDGLSKWIDKNVPNAQLKDFQTAFQKASAATSVQQVQTAVQIRDALTGTGLPLKGWQDWNWSQFPSGDFWKRVLGVLVSGLLLSLGAPFWFNSLSSLTNLKPLISSKNKSEEQAKQNS